jgi:hypothetical protein
LEFGYLYAPDYTGNPAILNDNFSICDADLANTAYNVYDNLFRYLCVRIGAEESWTLHLQTNKIPYIKLKLDQGFIRKPEPSNKLAKYNKQFRVKVMCCWCSSKELCEQWNRQSKGNFTWNNVTITWEDTDIDYYVIINYPARNEVFVPERTILFRMEPTFVSQNWNKFDTSKLLQVRTHDKFRNNSEWHMDKTYDQLMNEKITKTKLFSTVTSSSYISDVHRKRVDFIKFMERKFNSSDSKINIDVFGRSNEVGFVNYKGCLPRINKNDGLYPYMYTFAGENSCEHNYFTEKLCDAILAECLCFYYGCPNVSDYIDSRAYIQLDLTDFEKSYDIVVKAISENEYAKRIGFIRAAKYKILNELQFFPTVEDIIYEHQLNQNKSL